MSRTVDVFIRTPQDLERLAHELGQITGADVSATSCGYRMVWSGAPDAGEGGQSGAPDAGEGGQSGAPDAGEGGQSGAPDAGGQMAGVLELHRYLDDGLLNLSRYPFVLTLRVADGNITGSRELAKARQVAEVAQLRLGASVMVVQDLERRDTPVAQRPVEDGAGDDGSRPETGQRQANAR